tara:strand:+ start:90 stop:647 length:558 start_codon:yes stop_codon:yes gene_type:complete
MAFWTSRTDPKRKFNFQVAVVANGKIQNYFAKTATKPSFTIAAGEHNYLNHTFYYPGRLTWNDCTVTFVDPGKSVEAGGAGDSTSAALVDLLKNMGYNPPSSENDLSTISKSKAVSALGRVEITQLDDNGEALDEWVLINAWVSEVNFGDLDYASDDLVEISCTIKYDFAKFKEKNIEPDWLLEP